MVTLVQIDSVNMSYPQYQENIIFPARHFDESRGTFPWQYRNDDPTPTVLGCIDHTEICDSHGKKCWAPPSFFTPRAAFQWVREITTANQDLSLALLMGSLAGSGVCSALSGGSLETSINTYDFETASRCHFQSCSTLPVDQWKTEARRWFEASLARIQINVLDITRGTSNLGHADHDGIPPSLRGICQMGKFKSVAWRNVSVWGFLGLLFLAAAVTLASCKTRDDCLWLTVGIRKVLRALWWILKCAASLLTCFFRVPPVLVSLSRVMRSDAF